MAPAFTAADDIRRMLVGTPPVIASTGLAVSLDVFDQVDLRDLRAKSLALAGLFLDVLDASCADLEVVTPRDPERRGSQISLRHAEAYPIVRNLAERRVIGDFRAPDIMRFAFAPLYTRYVDAYDAAVALADVLGTGSFRDPVYAVRGTVT
jgi:kynureninase